MTLLREKRKRKKEKDNTKWNKGDVRVFPSLPLFSFLLVWLALLPRVEANGERRRTILTVIFLSISDHVMGRNHFQFFLALSYMTTIIMCINSRKGRTSIAFHI